MMQFVCAEVAGCAEAAKITEPVAAALGIEYTATITVSAAAPNYTAECLALKETGSQFAQVWVAAAGVARVIEECERQGAEVVYGGPPGGLIESLLNELPDDIELHTPTSGFPWFVDEEPVQQFREVMEEYGDGGEWQGGYGTYTWSSLEYFRLALENVSDDPTREEVRELVFALPPTDLDGLLANEVSFEPGVAATHWPCYFEVGLDQGELVNWAGGLEAPCTDL
jgi:branched-chain amino acid transport system substrate-binding protein